jgi:hypothetical protein
METHHFVESMEDTGVTQSVQESQIANFQSDWELSSSEDEGAVMDEFNTVCQELHRESKQNLMCMIQVLKEMVEHLITELQGLLERRVFDLEPDDSEEAETDDGEMESDGMF